MRLVALLLLATCALPAAERFTYWIEPSPDVQLARWAFEAWQRETNNALVFTEVPVESDARFKLHWVTGQQNLYGETRPYMIGGRRAANIYVLPETGVRSDPLLRDAIVYLTCVHETGHALGLQHTADFADIMYTFVHGGDITAYFARYRKLLKTRDDIAKYSGVSDADRVAIRGLYK